MTAPSFRHLALGELDHDGLHTMLHEGETLFVEFKKDIAKGTGFQIAKAAASFANTLGGWILVGVEGRELQTNWEPPPGDFVDAVRQRLEGHVDPLPSFAASIERLKGKKVGVIRVYESTDTPHILSDGSVVVREPAQDSKLRKLGLYEPAPIRSHHELLQLAQRGRDARFAAERRFSEPECPPIDVALRIRRRKSGSADRSAVIAANAPAVVVRLAPLTVTRRWIEWAVSGEAVEQLQGAVAALAGEEARQDAPLPFARGLAVGAGGARPQAWTPGANIHIARRATAAVDADGLIGIRLDFDMHHVGGYIDYQRHLTADEIRETVADVLEQAVVALADAEHLGRYAVDGYVLRVSDLYRIDPRSPGIEPEHPTTIPLSGELTVGGLSDDPDHARLTERWASEVLRSCGVPAWSTANAPAGQRRILDRNGE